MATGTEGLVTGTPARAAPVDDAFAELVYADHDLLCAEFDEIVETLSGRPPSSASHRRASAGTTERESADIVHTRCNCAAAFFSGSRFRKAHRLRNVRHRSAPLLPLLTKGGDVLLCS